MILLLKKKFNELFKVDAVLMISKKTTEQIKIHYYRIHKIKLKIKMFQQLFIEEKKNLIPQNKPSCKVLNRVSMVMVMVK